MSSVAWGYRRTFHKLRKSGRIFLQNEFKTITRYEEAYGTQAGIKQIALESQFTPISAEGKLFWKRW